MIDIMFFLLVFFMLSTINMTELRTVPVKMAQLEGTVVTQDANFVVTVDSKNQLYIGDAKVDTAALQTQAQNALRKNPNAIVVVKVDEGSSYKAYSQAIAALRDAGVTRFGLVSEPGK